MSRNGGLVEALAAVADYHLESKGEQKKTKHKRKHAADSDEDEKRSRDRDRRKDKKDKKKKRKKSKDREEERARKEERRKRRRKKKKPRKSKRVFESGGSSSEQDSESGTDSEGAVEGVRKSTGDAGKVVQKLLGKYPALFSELQQLLGTIDAGQAVDIASIADASLRELLAELFQALQLRQSSIGLYVLQKGQPPTLCTLGEVLDEQRTCEGGVKPVEDGQAGGESELTNERVAIGPAMPPCSSGEIAAPIEGDRDYSAAGGIAEEEAEEAAPVMIGPQGPPPAAMPSKRVIGPAMPPPEVLQAAAQLTEAEEELRFAEEEGPMIGPPPPAMVAEMENASEQERYDQVKHILAPTTTDPYKLLGIASDAKPGEIKKRYWKLSLLVHPDKCTHKQAQEAFTKLNKAKEELEDPNKRAAVDARIEKEKEQEAWEAELKVLREQAQWRKLRGEAQEGDEKLLGGPGSEAPARGTWMTELPPERQARGPSTTSTFFSKTEKRGRGDVSNWTDTPLEKAKKAQQNYLEAYSQSMLGSAEDAAREQEMKKASETAVLIDSYNEKQRAKSLLEKHQEATGKKKTTKKKKGDKREEEEEEWVGKHPWRPFDRDKDLNIGPKAIKIDKLSATSQLASRFGAGSASERRFL